MRAADIAAPQDSQLPRRGGDIQRIPNNSLPLAIICAVRNPTSSRCEAGRCDAVLLRQRWIRHDEARVA